MESQVSISIPQVFSAMFLVAGTCIGGGMLALPVATGISGFLPSIAMMIACWLGMTATALLLLEVSLWMEDGAHFISMTSRILGVSGKIVTWCLYLFISYASLVAYTAGGGVQIATAAQDCFNFTLHKDIGAVIFILVFGFIVHFGSQIIGRVNSILFAGMIVAYIALLGMGFHEIKPAFLLEYKWSGSLFAIPLLLTAFSCQTMIPSLTPYLKRNVKALRWAIIGGTSLSFLIYAVWQSLILGIVPVEGPNGLSEAFLRGEPATQFLRDHVDGRWIVSVAEYFAFFAIVTSFLGIGLGLFDFLADGLKIKKEGIGNLYLGLLIIIPTLIFATQFERIFLVALETSGGFGDSILSGLIPVLMVWVGRYYLGLKNEKFRFPGGKVILGIIFLFFFLTFIVEIVIQTGQMAKIYEPFEVPIHNFEPILK